MSPTRWGLVAFVACVLVSTGAVVAWDRASDGARGQQADKSVSERVAKPPPLVRASLERGVEPLNSSRRAPRPSLAEQLIQRLLGLMQQVGDDYDAEEIARLRGELLALGEGAAAPLLARLGSEVDTARRDLLLDLLRHVPGSAAESYLIREARSAAAGSTRSIAMDALAERGSDDALRALADIAVTDPELPSRPLVVPDQRGLEDRSTELPDEVDYTPRMKAMVALASTEDDRAVPMLLRVLEREREESLRMRAAEHLGQWQSHRLVLPALRAAASADASRYVRLAALHALDGADDPALGQLFAEIVERDPDAGVRLLAQRLLEKLSAPRP